MKKRINLAITNLTAVILLAIAGTMTFAPAALAATTTTDQNSANKTAICEGVGLTGGNCNDSSGPSVEGTIKLVVNILSWVVGIIAVIMVIVGGLKYVTSSGDASNVTSAKNTVLYAVVGLVVVALAQVLVRFVLTKVK